MTISQAEQELYKKYVQATKMKHIHNPLAWALFKVWRMADGKRNTRKITNFDRIKGMSVDEMAGFMQYVASGDFVADVCGSKCCPEYSEINMTCSGNCKPAIAKWLESEVDE